MQVPVSREAKEGRSTLLKNAYSRRAVSLKSDGNDAKGPAPPPLIMLIKRMRTDDVPQGPEKKCAFVISSFSDQKYYLMICHSRPRPLPDLEEAYNILNGLK